MAALVTTIYCKPDYVICPHCGHENGDWMDDPRQSGTGPCDSCEQEFTIHPDADLEISP